MSPRPAPLPTAEPPVVLHDRAAEQIRYIRDVMARAGEFTAVPGWGGVGMGVTALAAAFLAARQPSEARWLAVWSAEAVLAVAIGAVALVRTAGAQHVGRGAAGRPVPQRAA